MTIKEIQQGNDQEFIIERISETAGALELHLNQLIGDCQGDLDTEPLILAGAIHVACLNLNGIISLIKEYFEDYGLKQEKVKEIREATE